MCPQPVDQYWVVKNFPGVTSVSPLATGGQKSVFTCTHPDDGDVVLKIFHPDTETERALREIAAVKAINSQYTPSIIDFGNIDENGHSFVWVREERVPGLDLRQILANGPLPDSAIIAIGLNVLEALASAENSNIVHRDVKPENIIYDEATTSAKLLDFGIARHLDLDSLTSTANNFGLGTLGYFPPEQLRNRKTEIDSRADLFSLGVTLYECIEGINPHVAGARDPLEVIYRIENIPLPCVQRDIDGSGQIKDLILGMTRIRRDHRFASIADTLEWWRAVKR